MNRVVVFTVALATVFAAPALAKRDPAQVLMPPPGRDAAHQQWGFAEAVTHGDTVYLSGVVAGLWGDQPCKRAFNSGHSGGANWALGDGSVRFISYSVDVNQLMNMATMAGGEVATVQ